MAHINIEFTLFSAFYSPLISLMSGGFLKAEGLEADWTVSPPGVHARRHDHGGEFVADLRRRVRGARHITRECRTPRVADPCRDRRARGGRTAGIPRRLICAETCPSSAIIACGDTRH